MQEKPYHYNYFEQHRLYRDYRDFVLKDEYDKPILYTVGVYELDENEEAQLIEIMKLACDNDDWAIVNGRLYKKEGTCPVKSCPNCIRRVAMSKKEMLKEGVRGKKQNRFYKILEEKEFSNFLELRESLEMENNEDA